MKRIGGAALPLLLLSACATQSVTLLPGEEGRDGAVAVLSPDGSERGELTSGNTAARLGRGRAVARPVPPGTVAERYGQLVADLPPPAEHFILQFAIGEMTPSPDQEAVLERLFAAVGARAGAEVQVVGHTDRVDSEAVNDRLSRRRAEQVRDYLIARGLPAAQVRATWRGEREPLVETPDGVAEEHNRRVEVIVR